LGSKTGVSEHWEFTENLEFVLFRTFRKLQKMMLKSNFGYRKKLFPTRKPTRMFGLKFGMQGLSLSSFLLQNVKKLGENMNAKKFFSKKLLLLDCEKYKTIKNSHN